jgi:hypothetical protein
MTSPIIGDKYECKLGKASPFLDSIKKRRMVHRELKQEIELPNESLFKKHDDQDTSNFAKKKRKHQDQDLSTYLGAKPSFDRFKVIKAKQDRIMPSKIEEDPEKKFIHRNMKELDSHFHVKNGVKNRIPLKE